MLNQFFSRRSFLTLMGPLLIALSGCDRLADLPVGKGYTAKYLCSSLFNSDLDEDLVRDEFIAPFIQPLPLFWKIKVDYDQQLVIVGDVFFGTKFAAATAIYRKGIGCTILATKTINEIDAQAFVALVAPELPVDQPWPQGSAGLYPDSIPGLDQAALDLTVADAFIGSDNEARNTTSMVVVYDGKLIAEHYALGVTDETPVMGWSMTKSITSTLIGITQDLGLIDIDAPAPIPEWEGTVKEMIHTRHLLHMAAGLEFSEDSARLSDLTRMLFLEPNQAVYTASKPLLFIPGDTFTYSTGQANLLARIVQDSVGGSLQDAYNFYQTQFFHKIDIRSAFIEFDSSGYFVGGAYGFMTPRDWARLGQLYIQGGEWFGEQVVSAEWIDYALQPSPAAVDYGAQIWLNSDGYEWPELPEDTYYFSGYQGQQVIIIPSKKLVVVRTGVNTQDEGRAYHQEYILDILDALPDLD